MEARIDHAARGNREAMAQIVAEHYSAVFKFCARRIGDEFAKDAAQDTFITAQRALSKYDGSSKLLTFLFGIALNQCRNMARKTRREITFNEVWERPANDKMEKTLIDRQTLRAALRSLSKDHREVVLMHEVEGLTYEEISAVLNVPAGTVKSRLHNAFAALRTRLVTAEGVTA